MGGDSEPGALDARRLEEIVSGDEKVAARELLPLVYEHLRGLATRELAKRGPGETLQATALVHEAWLHVVGRDDPGWQCRAHFFGAAARAMREILIQQARRKSSLRGGGAWKRSEEAPRLSALDPEYDEADLLSLDEALARLEVENELQAQVVMLRFFTGLTMREIAEMLGLTEKRVEREWRFARAWLQRRLGSGAHLDLDRSAT